MKDKEKIYTMGGGHIMGKSGIYTRIICDGKGCGHILKDVPYDSTEELRAYDTKIHKHLTKEGWSFVEHYYCTQCEKKLAYTQ